MIPIKYCGRTMSDDTLVYGETLYMKGDVVKIVTTCGEYRVKNFAKLAGYDVDGNEIYKWEGSAK